MYMGMIEDLRIVNALTEKQESKFYTDLGGLLEQKNGVIVTPLQYSFGERSAGALIDCYSAGSPNDLAIGTVKTIILASLWVMIASFVAIYFITEKIVSPIKQMTYATRNFAKGQFDIKIPVVGEDEIAELATAFNSMADSLASYEYSRSSFLANVSHDLRTPMTSISGFIDGILEGAIPPEKQPYYLGIIGQEIKRLSRLVKSMLSIARIQAGDMKLNPTDFDVNELVCRTVFSFEQKIEEKKLEIMGLESDEVFVNADNDLIHQVVYNLIDNAVKFVNEGGCISFSYAVKDGSVFVSVKNTGAGIAAVKAYIESCKSVG
jgi:signal transduction histidine kinase